MIKNRENNIFAGLDIGTSKVVAIVGRVQPDSSLEIIGMGQHISKGLRKGVVANIESTVDSIQKAVEEAELTADCRINSVFAGIAGAHISSLNSHGVVAIRDKEVDVADIERVIDRKSVV